MVFPVSVLSKSYVSEKLKKKQSYLNPGEIFFFGWSRKG
jgi:hypothetical protein